MLSWAIKVLLKCSKAPEITASWMKPSVLVGGLELSRTKKLYFQLATFIRKLLEGWHGSRKNTKGSALVLKPSLTHNKADVQRKEWFFKFGMARIKGAFWDRLFRKKNFHQFILSPRLKLLWMPSGLNYNSNRFLPLAYAWKLTVSWPLSRVKFLYICWKN